MSRRLLSVALLAVLLFSTPALASLTITDRQQARTDLATGPQFFAFGSGTEQIVGASTQWDGFELEGLQIDEITGELMLGRAGDVAPSSTPWHDPSSSTRACETEAASSVRLLTFDVQREIDAGRLQADLADIRVYSVADGADVPFRTGSPDATSVVVDTTAFEEAVAVCVYWGNPAASSASTASVQGPVVADGGWSWRVWEADDGLSLDLVDWSNPSATGSVPTAAAPADGCNQCSNELVGFVTPTVAGSYRFYLSADEVGRLEIAPSADPVGLAPVVELVSATPSGQFDDPIQASEPVDLEAGETYAIRARSKDLEAGDHLEVAWALDGETPSILTADVISNASGELGSLTHRRFDVVATTDRSGEPLSTTRIEASEKPLNSGNDVANSIAGYVVIPESGSYRFWISSDDEGALLVSADGTPTNARLAAWITNFTEPDNWSAQASQRSESFVLDEGDVIWIEAHHRDRGGPDHLQVGWSRDDLEPATAPSTLPAAVLSEGLPPEAPLPFAVLGSVEGQQGSEGTFVSEPIDTTSAGSNVFGLMLNQSSGSVAIDLSFASSPDGPWSAPEALVSGQPVSLAADGLRYVRFSGQLSSSPDGDPSVASIGVERDLAEATSTDALTTIDVPVAATGDVAILRVRGSIGGVATATISNTRAGASVLSLVSANGSAEATFGDGTSHHVVVSVVPGGASSRGTWSVADPGGAVVAHEVLVTFS